MSQRVYVGGTFDLFHAGHVNFLRMAREIGPVWVSLNTDEFAERYKRKPIYSLYERIEIVKSCFFVSRVIVNKGDEDSRVSIEESEPDVIVHGDDWTGDEYLAQLGVTQEWLDEREIKLRYVPYTPSPTTTEIIERVQALGDRDVPRAAGEQPADPEASPRLHQVA